MWYGLSITAYDIFEDVTWHATVRKWEKAGDDQKFEVVYDSQGRFPGQGLSDPSKWLRTALEEMRESM